MRPLAEDLRRTILAAAPGATEIIIYQIPAFRLGKKTIVFFAVWKSHIGLYPIWRGDEAFEADVGPIRAKKDSVHLPLDAPLPHDLIARIVRHQITGSRA